MTEEHKCPPDHSHGAKSSCYTTHGCRCAHCRQHNTARMAHRRRQIAYGRHDSGYVDADPVRLHVNHLREHGMGIDRLATVTGVPYGVLNALLYGRRRGDGLTRRPPTKRIRATHAQTILAVAPDLTTLSPSASYPGLGVRRRLQALAARGWALTALAPHLGVGGARVQQYIHAESVAVSTHLRVAAMYDELWDQEPPRSSSEEKATYVRTINHARACRWVPPLGWNDIDTDVEPPATEQDSTIDEMAVELACSGERVRLNPAERREVVSLLHPRRWSDARIAEFADCDARTVLRIRQDLGLLAFDQNDLIDWNAA